MDFESPDVEREFPGLYASESARKSEESEVSDQGEKLSKKDLLNSKKKDKKDRGYATLEGESSPDPEQSHLKSPSRSKKCKTFKFTSKKEKKDKCGESKEAREKPDSDSKPKKKSDDKKKDLKTKIKLKDKKKSKQDETPETEEMPVFGVPLSVATERSKCHDGVDMPLIVRHCIDYVERTGMCAENVYKMSGIKWKVEQVKRLYNQREQVELGDYDLPTATSLLKQFLRELPEPVFTTEAVESFEEAASIQDVRSRGERLRSLVDLLPSCNRTLLTWLVKHFDNVCAHEKENKMNAQSMAVTLSPVLDSSQRLISALLCHASHIFPNFTLYKYVPPLRSSDCLTLPDNVDTIEKEVRKQQSLLEMLHSEMNHGLVTKGREEQLWEVQRIITQLKRRLKSLEKVSGVSSSNKTGEETVDSGGGGGAEESRPDDKLETRQGLTASDTAPQHLPPTQSLPLHTSNQFTGSTGGSEDVAGSGGSPLKEVLSSKTDHVWNSEPTSLPAHISHFKPSESLEVEEINKASILVVEKKQLAILETEELTSIMMKLRALCRLETKEITRITNRILQLGGANSDILWLSRRFLSDDESGEEAVSLPANLSAPSEVNIDSIRESKRLRAERDELVKRISIECDGCVSLKAKIKLLQMSNNQLYV